MYYLKTAGGEGGFFGGFLGKERRSRAYEIILTKGLKML